MAHSVLRYNPEEDASRPIASATYPPGHSVTTLTVTVVDLTTGLAVTATPAIATATVDPNVFEWSTAKITGVDLEAIATGHYKIVFTPDFGSPVYNDLEVNTRSRVHFSATYADVGTTVSMTCWMTRAGKTVTPTSTIVDWYKQDGTLLFQATSATPDANGSFNIQQVQALVLNEAYYVDLSITDATSTVVQRRGISHQA